MENRHERRVKAARQRYQYKLKGKPGFKLLRRMFRANSPNETVAMMHGFSRSAEKKHPGYAKMGDYTREGFKLAVPKQKNRK